MFKYVLVFLFLNDTGTTEIYTLSLHDALPIYLLREAIADAEQVRETAIANAKLQLEETIAPTIKAEITRALSQSEEEVEEAHDPQRGARAQDFAEVGEGVEASDEVEDDASEVEIVNEDEVSEETEEISEEAEKAERSEERRVGKECRSRWSPYH